jgi:hypothetical protein
MSKMVLEEEQARHGREARSDWRAYHSALESDAPTYHNRPDCIQGAAIEEEDLIEGTADWPLCDNCRSAEHPSK